MASRRLQLIFYRQPILCIVSLLFLDYFTKLWVQSVLFLGQVLPIFPFFNITLSHNTGAAFSFLANQSGWQRWALTGVTIVATIFFVGWLYRTPVNQKLNRWGLSLIISGALGNLWDRVSYGYVIDFLDFHWGSLHWPAFNVADSAICIGAFLLLYGFRKA